MPEGVFYCALGSNLELAVSARCLATSSAETLGDCGLVVVVVRHTYLILFVLKVLKGCAFFQFSKLV